MKNTYITFFENIMKISNKIALPFNLCWPFGPICLEFTTFGLQIGCAHPYHAVIGVQCYETVIV